jgi:branched-chain amino acid transport system substrate-binding protein
MYGLGRCPDIWYVPHTTTRSRQMRRLTNRRTVMNTRPFCAGLSAILVLLGFATLVQTDRLMAESKNEPVKIGAVYNLSGSQASLGQPSLKGSMLAVEQFNRRGGLLGRPVELIAVDGESDPALIAMETRKLVHVPGLSAITGLSDTTMVLAAAPIAEKARMVFLTSGATSPRVPIEFPNYYFMACFGDNTQAAAGAEYATSALGARTVYLISDETMDYTVLLARYFAERYLQLGGQIVGEDTYAGGVGDFSAQIATLKRLSTPPDMLYVAAGPDDIGSLVKQLREAGVDQPVVGGDGYDTPLLLETAGAAANDVYFTTHTLFDRAQATPLQERFIDDYQARFGHPPESSFAGLGYDAVNLLAAAIELAGSAKQKAVAGALEATRDFQGVTGTLSFAAGVHIPEKQVTIVRVTGGALNLAAVLTPQAVPQP